jgi:hypothetical protein
VFAGEAALFLIAAALAMGVFTTPARTPIRRPSFSVRRLSHASD